MATYKNFSITKGAKCWRAFDADGELFDIGRTQSQLRGAIDAFLNGEAWMIEDLRRAGYSKV